ncbi:MAG: hypothetical protein JSU99_04165 [Nitrospiraceae bacterium]|nr:MAG: hypothetical protein JSU99_04165 [Nitrospiraceae bacterium]
MIKTIQIVGNARYGGATNLMLKWCEYLLERGHTVDVLSTDKTMVSELRKLPDIQVFDSIFIPREIDPLLIYVLFFRFISCFFVIGMMLFTPTQRRRDFSAE